MPKHTTKRGPADQKDKSQPHPPEHRHQSPPPGSLHNTLHQPYHWEKTPKTTGTTNLQPAKRRPQTEQVKQNEKTEKYTADVGAR